MLRPFLALSLLSTVLCLGCGRADEPGSATALMDDAYRASTPEKMEIPSESDAFNTEAYDHIVENDFHLAAREPLSTFSIDVDTASYANVRRMLTQDQLPSKGAVRIEEFINYFTYDYRPPTGEHPFAVHVDVAECPWSRDHRLARIGLKGKEIHVAERPRSNLVFLMDVSGSMSDFNKLPYVKASLNLLVEQLNERDTVALVVYAGSSGLVLDATPADRKSEIRDALNRLNAGGSTNGGAGIQLAYDVATSHFIEGGVNRVILCTDGDFNVGMTNQSDLIDLIQQKARENVFLSVLGFGMGNYKDSTMEKLADKGNGNYAYIDTLQEAEKVLVEQMTGTLITIAKDVKIQIDFNPAHVAAYRLIGYENRMLRAEDFRDDAKDAGEIGAGHTVTALYELIPVGQDVPDLAVEPSKYQEQPAADDDQAVASEESFTVRLRYKLPEGSASIPFDVAVVDEGKSFDEAVTDFRFASAVAAFGMLLRDSKYKGDIRWDDVSEIVNGARGMDSNGYRAEFAALVKKAKMLKAQRGEADDSLTWIRD
ncbi:MAG: VWA domain-containing protein [Planctomycetaceae bacterium]